MKNAVVVHPDKLELFLRNTTQNTRVLSGRFHDLTRLWTDRWNLQWKDMGKDPDEFGRWKSWEIVGASENLQIRVHGPAYHVREKSRGIRTFSETHWIDAPFPDPRQCLEFYHPRLPHLGWLRITDQQKNKPLLYTSNVFAVLRDIADYGILDSPRRVEIALDCWDLELARDLRLSLRLQRGSNTDLVHFFPGLQGMPFRGPHPFGDREYQHFYAYRDGLRQLVCYPRWEDGYYRIELRLGPRSLRRYTQSQIFGEVRDPDITGTTFAVLASMPTLIERNLVSERMDLPLLHADYPRTKNLALDTLSVRGQRYRLVQAGFSLGQINRYAVRLPLPPMTILTPREVSKLLRGQNYAEPQYLVEDT